MSQASNPLNEGDGDDREVYRPGRGRRIAFSAIFVLLLPFFLSLGPMLFWRVSQGQWFGTLGLFVMATLFAMIMFLIVVELMFSIRSEVTFGKDGVDLVLPSGRGPTPMLRYRKNNISYASVGAVETRHEVYGSGIVPVALKGTRIKLKSGDYVKLGYVSEDNVDPALPYTEIGEKIAARSGAELIDGGHVYRSVRKKLFGDKASGDEMVPLTSAEVTGLKKRHRSFVMGMVGVLVVLVGLGILFDRDHRVGGLLANTVSMGGGTR